MDSVRAAGSSRSIPRRRKPKNKILLSIWRRKEKREEKISQNGKSVLHIMSYTVPVIYTYWVNKLAFNQKGWGGGGGEKKGKGTKWKSGVSHHIVYCSTEVTTAVNAIPKILQIMCSYTIFDQIEIKTRSLSIFIFLSPFPSPTRLLFALTTSPSLILPGTLESFLTQTCPWRSTS